LATTDDKLVETRTTTAHLSSGEFSSAVCTLQIDMKMQATNPALTQLGSKAQRQNADNGISGRKVFCHEVRNSPVWPHALAVQPSQRARMTGHRPHPLARRRNIHAVHEGDGEFVGEDQPCAMLNCGTTFAVGRNEPRCKVFDRQRGQWHIAACKRERRMTLGTQLQSMTNNLHFNLHMTRPSWPTVKL
jgi:hypothetical protein